MSIALTALRIAVAVAFLCAGLLALGDWAHGRDRRRGYLALALGCLGLTALSGPLGPLLGHPLISGSVALVLLVASAAGMLLFRNSIVRLPVWGAVAALVALVGSTAFILAIVATGGASATGAAHGLELPALDILVVVWSLSVLEPAYRLVRVSRGLPRIQRSRLRSLAAGYALLAVVLLVGVFGASLVKDAAAGIALEAVALACVPLFYLSFAPSTARRRRWRQPEQDDLTRATHDLLLFSPDRRTLATRGLEWAVRILGGTGGLVVDAQSQLLAVHGLDAEDARALASDQRLRSAGSPVRAGPRGRAAMARRLPLQDGEGLLVVVSGPLSPSLGRYEVEWLEAYAASMTIALDRVRVAELSAETEAELRAARDLAEEASRTKSEFLSRVSHELRTPLTAMIGFAELLLLEEITEKQRRHVRTILRAGDHLLALINDILDVARIEEGRLPLSPQPVRLGGIVAEVLDLVRPMASDRAVSVRDEAASRDVLVVADGQRLKQVLLNLVTNAVKYNRTGGLVEISAVRRDQLVRVSVRDTGPGLAAEDVGKLFAPFERLGAAGTDVEGTGLGLAVSKSLLEAMGGRIGVDTRLGAGSTFWIELPVPTGASDGGAPGGLAEDRPVRLTGLSLLPAGSPPEQAGPR